MSSGFIGVRPRGRRFRLGSLGSLRFAMVFVWFCRSSWVYFDAPWVSSGSSGVAVFIGVRIGVVGFISGRWMRWGTPLWSSDLLGVAWFFGVRPVVLCVHPEPLGSLGCAFRIVGFIQSHWDAHWVSSGSYGVAGFFVVRPEDRQVRPGSLGSLGCAIGTSGSSGVAGFIVVRAVGGRVDLLSLSS